MRQSKPHVEEQPVDVEAPSGWSSLRRRADEALWNDRAARPFASRDSDPLRPDAGGGGARVPGSDAESPCHGPRLRHLAVARAISRRGGLGAQGVRRPVSAGASADENAGAARLPRRQT